MPKVLEEKGKQELSAVEVVDLNQVLLEVKKVREEIKNLKFMLQQQAALFGRR